MIEPIAVEKSQVKTAAAVLARAFHDDPPMVYSVPDHSRRLKCHLILTAYIRHALACGEVYAASTNFEGIAVWLPSNGMKTGMVQDLRNGWLSILLNLGIKTVKRQREIAAVMGSVHERCISSPHQYLFFLGVEPHQQGKGYAAGLMRTMLDRADRESFACYLDNTKEENLPFYRHFGFEVVEEYSIPGVTSNIWAMVRTPYGKEQR